MPFTAQCPTCSSTLQVPDELAGQVVKCSNCGTMLQMPPASALPPPAAPPPPPAAPVASEPALEPEFDEKPSRESPTKKPVAPKKGGSKLPLILGGVAAALFVVCGGGCAGIYFLIIAPARDKADEIAKKWDEDIKKSQKDVDKPATTGSTLTVDELSTNATKLKGTTVTVRGKIVTRENLAVKLEPGKSRRTVRLKFSEDEWERAKPVQGDEITVRGTVSQASGSTIELTECEVVK